LQFFDDAYDEIVCAVFLEGFVGQVQRKFDAVYSGVKYRHVIDANTRQAVLLPRGAHDGVIGGIVNFYVADKHQGHLVCPDCEQAEMVYVAPYAQMGGNKKVRGHFRLAHGEKHSAGCISDLRMDEVRDPSPDNKDYTKGPVIYINSMAAEFNRLAGARYQSGRGVLFDEGDDGVLRVQDQDLVHRERFSVQTPHDLFRIMKRISPERLKDSRIVYGDRVTEWSHFMVRLVHKEGLHNTPSFYRFIELAKDLFANDFHPVMLHFNMDGQKMKEIAVAGNRSYQRVALNSFTVAHNGKKLTVQPLVSVFHQDAIARLREGGDIFALTLPKIKKSADNPNLYFMIFDIVSKGLVVSTDIRDVARSVGRLVKTNERPSEFALS